MTKSAELVHRVAPGKEQRTADVHLPTLGASSMWYLYSFISLSKHWSGAPWTCCTSYVYIGAGSHPYFGTGRPTHSCVCPKRVMLGTLSNVHSRCSCGCAV